MSDRRMGRYIIISILISILKYQILSIPMSGQSTKITCQNQDGCNFIGPYIKNLNKLVSTVLTIKTPMFTKCQIIYECLYLDTHKFQTPNWHLYFLYISLSYQIISLIIHTFLSLLFIFLSRCHITHAWGMYIFYS